MPTQPKKIRDIDTDKRRGATQAPPSARKFNPFPHQGNLINQKRNVKPSRNAIFWGILPLPTRGKPGGLEAVREGQIVLIQAITQLKKNMQAAGRGE